jgi:hypothetical protein
MCWRLFKWQTKFREIGKISYIFVRLFANKNSALFWRKAICEMHTMFGKQYTDLANFDLILAFNFVGEIKGQIFHQMLFASVFSLVKKRLVKLATSGETFFPS